MREAVRSTGRDRGVAIHAVDVSKTYRLGHVEVPALKSVSVEIMAGEMVDITGRSGSGKSTLLRQLGLIDQPTSGRVLLEGEDVTGIGESRRAQLRLTRLGYVFQEYALIPELTARENVYLPAMMHGASRAECGRRSREMLETVSLGDRMNHRPKELSGGEQQRVAIARALVNEPSIVYADEPTANLDSAAGRTVMETLAQLNADMGVTVVFVSHAPEDRAYAGKTITLADGVIEAEE